MLLNFPNSCVEISYAYTFLSRYLSNSSVYIKDLHIFDENSCNYNHSCSKDKMENV